MRVIAVGKKHEDWVAEGIERYQKRLKRPFDVEWVLLPHSAREGLEARQEESERIFSKLGSNDYVILLDERGRLYSSTDLSHLLEEQLTGVRPVSLIIGGAYGVNETLRHRANLVWSLSPLVFPHQLVRLLLIEQVYRSQEIAAGRPYHHE